MKMKNEKVKQINEKINETMNQGGKYKTTQARVEPATLRLLDLCITT